ncbi:MAG: acyltransferase domain-containing protein [Oscillospiraceae bacterium]|nr:acyltransferase domain-containing protein [Oscillospiraceae bacterium]
MLEQIFDKLDMSQEARNVMADMRGKYGELQDLQNDLFNADVSEETLVEKTSQRAKELGVHEYTFALYLLVISAKKLRERYDEQGISDEIFWDSLMDIKYKMRECQEVHGIIGTFVFGWFSGFYRMQRFALGRMQYDIAKYWWKTPYENGDLHIEKGYPILSCHIPSSGEPLTKAVRLDSYRRAYEFTAGMDGYRPLVIICDTWLFYPEHKNFLPKNSNILDFMDDFTIVEHVETDGFPDAWRIFAAASKLPPEQWPTDTSLQRAFAERVRAGLPTGLGRGLLIFDGENIVHG